MLQVVIWNKLSEGEKKQLLQKLLVLNKTLCHGQIGAEFFKYTIMDDTDVLILSRDAETRRTYSVKTKKVRSRSAIRGSTYTARPTLSKTMKSTRRNNTPKELAGSIRGFVSIKDKDDSYYINLVCRAPSTRASTRSVRMEDPGKAIINKVSELARRAGKPAVTLSALPHVIGYYYKVFGYKIDGKPSDKGDRNSALEKFMPLLKSEYQGNMEEFLEDYSMSYSKIKNNPIVKAYNMMTLGQPGKIPAQAKKIAVDGLHMTLGL